MCDVVTTSFSAANIKQSIITARGYQPSRPVIDIYNDYEYILYRSAHEPFSFWVQASEVEAAAGNCSIQFAIHWLIASKYNRKKLVTPVSQKRKERRKRKEKMGGGGRTGEQKGNVEV